MNLDLLNKEQKEAVEFMDGPLLVIAGAGSGKTKVLTTRIANLVEKGVDPTNILAITFTNKAAKEMKERVINILGPVAYETTISTFHSFGLRIIKVNYALLGYDKNFTILDSDDVLTIIKKILKDMNLDPKKYNPKAIRNKISSCKNELIDSKGFLKYVNTDFDDITQKVFSKYEEKLKQNSSVDFDDLLILPIILFRSHPDVLKNYQELYKYILIDEYQDTNEAQYILVKMISAKYKNICVVGDESQSIYSFRGSNYRNILNFEKDYKDAKVILLERNYRSTKKILDVANSIIKNNKERKDKKLWTDNESGDNTVYHRALDEKDEAKYVTEKIEKLIDDGVSKKDIAVLYRTNAQSRNIEEALLHDNVPYKVVGSFYFYNRKEIKDLISYLKLIYNHKDDVSLSRIINVPKRGIGPKTIENLNLKASSLGKSIFEVIDSGKELEFKKLIEEIEKESEHLSLTELVDFVLEKSGMKEELVSEKSLEADIRLENLEEFKSITKSFEENHGIVSLEDFLEEISLVSDIEEHKKNDDVVTLMTVHSSKGLEFEYVFLIGMEESIFPHINSFDSASAIEEERRLCYVAVTRAKKKLWIINAKKRILYGNDVSNIPSRFINEIDENLLDVDKEEKNSFIKSNILNKKVVSNEEYNVGDRVMHDVFGQGVIITVDKSLITVAFPHPHGIKKLMKGHSSIRKV